MWLDNKVREILESTFGGGTTLAVEMGDSHLTVLEFSYEKGAPKLINSATVDIPLNTYDVSSQGYFDTVLTSFKEIYRQKGMKSRKIILAIPDSMVFKRYVRLPPVSPDKIYQIVKYEAQQNVSFPLDEMAWDYQVFDSKTSYGELSVLLVAIKNDIICSLVGGFKEAGFKVMSIEPCSNVLANVLKTHSHGSSMCIDIGFNHTSIVFMNNDFKTFSRSVPMGGHLITKDIAQYFSVDPDEAERMKIFLASVSNFEGTAEKVKICNLSLDFATRLKAEITRSINFYLTQCDGLIPDTVYLTGGGSLIDGMGSFLSQKLHLPVESLKVNTGILQFDNLSRIRGEIVTGLSLKGTSDKESVINLLNNRSGKSKWNKKNKSRGKVCDICPFRK